MENNKYYVPEITEFCVGFEYEIDDEKLTYFVNSPYPLNIIEDFFITGKAIVRVKYLDKEDIESLGWKRDKLVKSEYYTILENVLIVRKSIIHIFELKDYESEFPSFKGAIKNKSELRKIMEMLDIKK